MDMDIDICRIIETILRVQELISKFPSMAIHHPYLLGSQKGEKKAIYAFYKSSLWASFNNYVNQILPNFYPHPS